MQANMYEVLKFNDQFFIEKKIGRIAKGFEEGDIEFAPTYKLAKGKDLYALKHRIPGWTDRIIFKSTNNQLRLKSYDSNNELKHSDHRCVFAQFECDFDFHEGFEDVYLNDLCKTLKGSSLDMPKDEFKKSIQMKERQPSI